MSRIEVREGPTGRRRWPDDLKVRIVAESFQPGARVCDVAAKCGLIARHLSGWRGSACVAGLQPGACGGFGRSAEEGAVIFPDQAVRIVIATKPVDVRKGHDGLAAKVHAELGFAPKAGVMVVFRSKRGDRIKVLFRVSHGSRHWFKRPWRKSGIVMICKRLEQGGFGWPKVGDGAMQR